jgi:hypothetical protein
MLDVEGQDDVVIIECDELDTNGFKKFWEE